MYMTAILLIEDDLTFSRILEGFLTKNNYNVTIAHKGKTGLQEFKEKKFDLVLLDYRLPDTTGMEVLTEIKATNPNVPVLIMTGFSDIRTAVRAIQAGALEYITKPVNPEELLMMLQTALNIEKETPSSSTQGVVTTRTARKPTTKKFVEGKSDQSKQLHQYVALVAPTDMSVIIEGESGTGKEYVARSIHRLSKRSNGPFVAVDCGALSKELAASELFGHVKGAFTGAATDKMGQFEAAQGGTLFLDEVGNLSYEVQVKLLRAIQERIIQPIGSNKDIKVDVRIITATNDELTESIKRGGFREDLYHRLNEFKLSVPPLRSRHDDLLEFINHFREEANDELGNNATTFDAETLAIFKRYDWPGNLRELRNTIRRSVLLTTGEVIGTDALPPELVTAVQNPLPQHEATLPATATQPVYDLKALQETHERELIIKTLQDVKYNKSKAARILNIDRKTLYLKMERYGLE
jgi:two-component system response regulator HydG